VCVWIISKDVQLVPSKSASHSRGVNATSGSHPPTIYRRIPAIYNQRNQTSNSLLTQLKPLSSQLNPLFLLNKWKGFSLLDKLHVANQLVRCDRQEPCVQFLEGRERWGWFGGVLSFSGRPSAVFSSWAMNMKEYPRFLVYPEMWRKSILWCKNGMAAKWIQAQNVKTSQNSKWNCWDQPVSPKHVNCQPQKSTAKSRPTAVFHAVELSRRSCG